MNLISDKKYIGKFTKANNETEFQKSNYWGSGNYIKRSILKNGKDSFIKYIIENNIFDHDLLFEREKYWIKSLNTIFPNGYNLNEGGKGVAGLYQKIKENKNDKISLKRKGFKFSNESKRKMSNSAKGHKNNLGRIQSISTKQKISNKLKGIKLSKEHSDKIKIRMLENNPFKGKEHSESSKLSISITKKFQNIHKLYLLMSMNHYYRYINMYE